MASQERLFSVW